MMKITIKREDLPKRRNPEFLAARKRKAGAHEKPYNERRNNKAALQKEWA